MTDQGDLFPNATGSRSGSATHVPTNAAMVSAHRLRQELGHHGIDAELHAGDGRVMVAVGGVARVVRVFCDGMAYLWRAEGGQNTSCPADAVATAAGRVALQYRRAVGGQPFAPARPLRVFVQVSGLVALRQVGGG